MRRTPPRSSTAGRPGTPGRRTPRWPTLVLYGTGDPLFPLDHGRALAAEIPGAGFLAMPATGHEVFPPSVWDEVVPAILAHTAEIPR